MASTVGVTAEQPTNIEVFPWLKTLPVAPEYHPTLAEFQDPIGYIFKIEKEASKYGICKIVPPVPPPPKKTAIANLNRSLAARSASSDPKSLPTFTTRQQQIGFCPRKHRPVQKPVWQSGEYYTVPQFEAKAKAFEKDYLKKASKKALSAPEIETLYWKATVDKPFSVEYANDMPGSAFAPVSDKKRSRETGDGVNVGETAWNMRGVSRAQGSLLRFMKEEIPGVTSPMVYIAMMFSWFAWHVEDHDLHSLNYLHTGAGKTWYGVPRDAAVAFEEVIRVHGYGGEINPIVTFSTLGEKTTVMSPEVLINAGVPCCRLVQNAGEFVVTFPRAYHSGFSHGFNFGEAANIATPGWLIVAKDAAIRRASINCPPMVSHFQLLYDLAISLYSRVSMSVHPEPRSSRLKDKKKGEGEILVKEFFVQDFIQNNKFLHALGKGSSVVLLPQNTLENSIRANLQVRSQLKVKPNQSFGICSPDDAMVVGNSLSDETVKQPTGYYPLQGKFSSLCERNVFPSSDGNNSESCSLASQTHAMDNKSKETPQCDRLSDRGLFSCVTCGILCFACVAIVQPREPAAQYLMSAKCSTLSDSDVNSGLATDGFSGVSRQPNDCQLSSSAGWLLRANKECLYDVPVQSSGQMETSQESMVVVSDSKMQNDTSSLGLLALNYGDDSDSEEDPVEADISVNLKETKAREFSSELRLDYNNAGLPSFSHYTGGSGSGDLSHTKFDVYEDELPLEIGACEELGHRRDEFSDQTFGGTGEFQKDPPLGLNSLAVRFRQRMRSFVREAEALTGNARVSTDSTNKQLCSISDEDSSRLHVFCLEHAVEVEQQVRPIGGVHVLLFCHPDYPQLEAEAKLVAEELGADHGWSEIEFREANKEDEERIQLALDSEEAIHGNGDWAVKLGINLYYSANLSRSPLYSKQMPYNSIIYDAFGRISPSVTPTKPKAYGKGLGKQKKISVAGKWCGKVWMSNQVHPLLAERDAEEENQGRIIMAEVKSDAELERQPDSTHAPKTPSITRTGKKRKSRAEIRPIIYARIPKVEDSIAALDDSPVDVSHKQQNRNPRNKGIKKETPQPLNKCERRRNRQFTSRVEDEMEGGISTRLRKRSTKPPKESKAKPSEAKSSIKKQSTNKKANKAPSVKASTCHNITKMKSEEKEHSCDMEGCTMMFGSKQELSLHKRNICPVKGCYKKFFSHKYLVQHRRVHMDDRPLKCPWKGCKMTFKWAWARTEHIRVHTGARPYVCKETGCGQTFRFVSDFSRHKRKTGHSTKKGRV